MILPELAQSPSSPHAPGEAPLRRAAASRILDRQLALALLLAAAVVLPRSISMAVSHSESYDDLFHTTLGLSFLTGTLSHLISLGVNINDAPLGQSLTAWPLLVANIFYDRSAEDTNYYTHPLGRETLAAICAVWRGLLFLPLVAVVFTWCRNLYGLRSAWLATLLLIVEPSFAAHLPVAALDVLGVTGIVIAAYAGWRFVEGPTLARAIVLGILTAFAVLLKHTAVILPGIYIAYACVVWVVKPLAQREGWNSVMQNLPGRLRLCALAGLVALASLWPLTLFDMSPPLYGPAKLGARGLKSEVRNVLRRKWPAGIYLHAFYQGSRNARAGHLANYFFGEHRRNGWWQYFPVLLTYKVPIGIGLIFVLAVLTFRQSPPTWDDCSLLIPWASWTLLLVISKINIGFRHYLPAYIFLIMFSSRSLVHSGPLRSALVWTGLAAVALHGASYHPDYISYLNFPRSAPYLVIGDSNLDWGQSLKEVGHWLDEHAISDRPVYLSYFGTNQGGIEYYLKGRVTVLADEAPPGKCTLIVSPCTLVNDDHFKALRRIKPDDLIGHGSMLVFHLD